MPNAPAPPTAPARAIRPLAVALLLAFGVLSLAKPAEAGWHGHWHGGGCCWGSRLSFSFGWPAYYYGGYGFYDYPAYYPSYAYAYPYYPPYYPPVYVLPSPPPVTIIQQPPAIAAAPPPVQYWYYCDNPRGYYPYVQSCSRGWKPVPATPPGAPAQ